MQASEPPPEPAPPSPPPPVESPLVLWSTTEQAVVGGKLVDGAWVHDHDIPVEVIGAAVVDGRPVTLSGGAGTFSSPPRWDYDRFVASLSPAAAEQPVLASRRTWAPFPRRLVEHALSEAERARVDATLTASGARGPATIARTSRVDLDGDGADELLVSVHEQTLYDHEEGFRDGDFQGLVALPGDGSTGHWLGEVHGQGLGILLVTDVQASAVADLDGHRGLLGRDGVHRRAAGELGAALNATASQSCTITTARPSSRLHPPDRQRRRVRLPRSPSGRHTPFTT